MATTQSTSEATELRNETRALARRVRAKLWKAYYTSRQFDALSEAESKRLDKICADLTALLTELEK